MKSGMNRKLQRLKKWVLSTRNQFIISGILATLWFLIRVIPKPSRAHYPCMRMAAPLMSGFVVYLLSLGGISLLIRNARAYFLKARYRASTLLAIAALVATGAFLARQAPESMAASFDGAGPEDGPNQPIGQGSGLHPGRVVWVWNPEATNENCVNVFDLPRPENTNQGVVNRMVVDGIRKLTGEEDLAESWDALFRAFNDRKSGTGRSYAEGEKIFIKVNQGTALNTLKQIDDSRGFKLPERITGSQAAKEGQYGTCETFPAVALEILRELVYVVGVDEKDIAIGDPIAHIYDYNYQAWSAEFPDVHYVDKSTPARGRTLIHPTEEDLLFYADKSQQDKLYDVIENADYLINLANLKPHSTAGVSFTAKNHFGSHARERASHLHYSLVAPLSPGRPSNGGYRKYRAQVDLMGSKYLGRNTLLYVVDGLYGGGSHETRVPVKYFMPPFYNDWSNSVFLSQDQVALESVCYDFLRSEWNGSYQHNAANNRYETMVNARGVDDYLHQAADSSNWPEGIIYDPDRSGMAMASLGIHEHWNNAGKKQYSRNLGLSRGIELLSVPDSLVGGDGPGVSTVAMWKTAIPDPAEEEPEPEPVASPGSGSASAGSAKLMIRTVLTLPIVGEFEPGAFYRVVVDHDNTKWFLSEAGIVSLAGESWNLHHQNRSIPVQGLKEIAYDSSAFGMELWLASPRGATVATIPVDGRSGATTYDPGNSGITSENVTAVTVGKGSLRWFGTDKGIAAFLGDTWLTPAYQRKYPEYVFQDFPISAIATNPGGDSLYIATRGAGVCRVYRNDVDAISGASEYAQWGPILLPSDQVNCICIEADGTQWFGTDAGVARHRGSETLENWMVLDTANGLVHNQVQSIAVDQRGWVWIGTGAGVSIYRNNSLLSFRREDGLLGENVHCIAVDREGIVWIGTDRGITSYDRGDIIRYH